MTSNDKIQQEIMRLEQELQNLKIASTFIGDVDAVQYEHYTSSIKVRIYYNNPTQKPITVITLNDYDTMKILGPYDDVTNSQVAYFTQSHNILLLTSTQPILRVENIA